jgi:hypothetical protein
MVTLVLLATLLSPVNSAQASAVQFFKNKQTTRCLDDSAQFGVRSFPCNGLNYQDWLVTRQAQYPSDVVMRNQNTQLCLDDSAEFGLRTFGCNGLIWQRWSTAQINGYVRLQNAQTHRCLVDIGGNPNSGRLAVQDCDGYNPDYQLWH